jgi:hypothetical protein
MEHELCISAFEIVAADIDHFESGNDMLAAYLQNCPVAVRDKLENLIGCPTRDNFVPKTQKILQNVRIE